MTAPLRQRRTAGWAIVLIGTLMLTACGGAGTPVATSTPVVATVPAPTATAPVTQAPTATSAPSPTRPPVAPSATATSAAPAPTPPPAGQPTATPSPGGSPVTPPAVQAAINDLAQRRGVPPARITVASTEQVEWPNAGIGCPEPDRAYAAVITPGWRVRLTIDGQSVTYHTNASGSVLTPCPRP